MRIVGGRFRGKRLFSPEDRSIRPTGDRARESLFNILDHHGLIEGMRFLDLFSGTGAVGLEAYSRGAAEVWLMDQDLSIARANVDYFDRPANVHLHHQDRLTRAKPPARFDLAFLDPPYQKSLAEPALLALREGWLCDQAWIVLEMSTKETVEIPPGFFKRQERRYGRAKMLFLGFDQAL